MSLDVYDARINNAVSHLKNARRFSLLLDRLLRPGVLYDEGRDLTLRFVSYKIHKAIDMAEFAIKEGCDEHPFCQDTSGPQRSSTSTNLMGQAIRLEVLDAMSSLGRPVTPTELANAMGRKRSATQKLLGRMVADGQVRVASKGYYLPLN